MTTKQYEAAPAHRKTGSPAARWLRRTGGWSALLVGLVFLIAALDLLRAMLQPGVDIGWATWLQDNWLMVIIKLHAGFQDVHPDMLYGLNFLDLLLMLLIGITYLGLFAALRRVSRIGSGVALGLIVAGMLLFIITQSAGRSAVMAAGVVISFVMLRSRMFGTNTAALGLFASVLLLIGDFTVGYTPSLVFALVTGLGYIFQTMWLFRVGRRLLILKKKSRRAEDEEKLELPE